MKTGHKWSRLKPITGVIALMCIAVLAGCDLPRSGPSKSEVLSGAIEQEGDAYIIPVDQRIAQLSETHGQFGFPASLLNQGLLGSDVIFAGDTLSIGIFENVRDEPLLGNTGQRVSILEQVQVQGSGDIYVPYAGNIKAAGETPESLRKIITARLDRQTPDPQVVVNRDAGLGAAISVMGFVAGPGVYPIEYPTRRLLAMIAKAGGVAIDPQATIVRLTRAGKSYEMRLPDLYADPKQDIALRPGDQIVIERDTRAFVAFGATGVQARIPFETETITAMDALASVGGLNSLLADPESIFVFRDEVPEVLNGIFERDVFTHPERVVYVLDITGPNGVFDARDFKIRSGDTVYVTEASFVKSQKAISSVTGAASGLSSTVSLYNAVR